MYLKLDFEFYEKICDITGIDYEATGEFIPADGVIDMLEDLLHIIDIKDEQLEDLKQDILENYEPIPPDREYGENGEI